MDPPAAQPNQSGVGELAQSFVAVSRVVPTSSASCSWVRRMCGPRWGKSPVSGGAAVASRHRTAATRCGTVLSTVSASRCSTSASRGPSPVIMRVAMRVSDGSMLPVWCQGGGKRPREDYFYLHDRAP